MSRRASGADWVDGWMGGSVGGLLLAGVISPGVDGEFVVDSTEQARCLRAWSVVERKRAGGEGRPCIATVSAIVSGPPGSPCGS